MSDPYYMKWERSEFESARKRQYEACKHENGTVDASGFTQIVVPPPDEIICDACNAEILTQWVHVTRHGSWAVCDHCAPKWMEEK
jgi:hypothetical protein